MEIFIFTALAVIIGTALFIAFAFRWLSNQWQDNFRVWDVGPLIIEKRYKAVDLYSRFKYTTMDGIINRPFDYFSTERVVRDDDHKTHIIKQSIRDLADKMVDDGFIEITDREDIYNPFCRQVEMRVKVYKPEPILSDSKQ